MSDLVFDGQIFQTPAWHRGMGKYSLELIRSIAIENQTRPVWRSMRVVLSRHLVSEPKMIAALNELPGVVVDVLDLLPGRQANYRATTVHNRQVVDDFLAAKKITSCSYLILSLLQAEICAVFPSSGMVKKSLLFYDLIPLMFHKTYLYSEAVRDEYLEKFDTLLEADSYLAISKTVANDLSTYLGVAPARIVSIDGGPIPHSRKSMPLAISKPFILMPTGNDVRKNNRRGIEGFCRFNETQKNAYHLVITSYFTEEEKKEFQQISDKIIFTDNVSGAELNYLYDETVAVLFPSEYEGLGLPVLEALEHNKPVACSDIPVFREISSSAFAYFDPRMSGEIAESLREAIDQKNQPSRATIKEILSAYTWEKTALAANEKLQGALPTQVGAKPKIVVVSAQPTGADLAGKMILQSQYALSRACDVMYLQDADNDTDEQRVNFLPYVAKTKNMADTSLLEIPADRIPVYYATRHAKTAKTLMLALGSSGVVLLHDLNLKPIWDELLRRGLISAERFELEKALQQRYGTETVSWAVSLLASQRTVVVFSEKAEREVTRVIKAADADTKIMRLDLPANSLVYPEIAPTDKSGSIAPQDVWGLEDREYEDVLSRAAKVLYDKDEISTDFLLPYRETRKYHTASSKLGEYDTFSERLKEAVNDEGVTL